MHPVSVRKIPAADASGYLIFTAVGSLIALAAAGLTHDELFRIPMLIFAACGIFASFFLTAGISGGGLTATPSEYSDGVIKAGVIATLFWGAVAMLVGVVIAAQLSWPNVFYFADFGWLNFGRLRPIHTSGVVFAFGGNALIATSFYVVQRTCRARLAGGLAPWFVFWGYQLFLVLAVTGYVTGVTQSKEYAEPEWYTDLWLTLVWVVYLLVFLGTLWKRKEPHIYVANWFYLAFIVTIALLHLVNNAALPVSFLNHRSYSAYAGVQDALVQWWYGHNAVGFFLTAGFLAMMYYFVPKRVNRPVYSYRLSIVHFWSLIFIYIWAGPHHLHYTALPQWTQTLGMTFSIMLWMPSWGGMINGLMTLSGAWDKLRTDPVVRMMVVALAFYGMSTFEGPVMSIRAVNSLSHYTDWTIGHVHSGALGWVGFITFACVYCMVPWLWKKEKMFSDRLIEWHFWIATTGILLYITAMWVSGVMEGLMWREYTPQGFLANSFVETVSAKHVENIVRTVGGLMYLSGLLIMIYNVIRTVRLPSMAKVDALASPRSNPSPWELKTMAFWDKHHGKLERHSLLLVIGIVLVVSIGGMIEIAPLFYLESTIEKVKGVRPYTPLELAGRDIYVREGCYLCHSQMIRPLRDEVERYGHYSLAAESMYDHPFQWGSKRTGPDLARVGGKYSDDWHRAHLTDPRSLVPESVMPPYAFLANKDLNLFDIKAKLETMRRLGVPYTQAMIDNAEDDAKNQADPFGGRPVKNRYGANLAQRDFDGEPDRLTEMDALIAYLQGLGNQVDFSTYKASENSR